MAFLAGRNNVIPTQMRLRVGNRQDVVGPMAVITLRGFRVAQLRYFAMVRIEVCPGNFFVAPPALCHDIQLEAFLISTTDCVRCVAVAAYG
jgi:hypothetical protein